MKRLVLALLFLILTYTVAVEARSDALPGKVLGCHTYYPDCDNREFPPAHQSATQIP